MSEVVNFDSILDKSVADVAPKLLPVGTYFGDLESMVMDKSKKKGTPLIRFVFALNGADSDVDETELAVAGGLTTSQGPRKLQKDYFYIEAQSAFGFGFDKVIRSAGISEDTPLRTLIEDGPLTGRSAAISVNHRMETNEQNGNMETYLEITQIVFQ